MAASAGSGIEVKLSRGAVVSVACAELGAPAPTVTLGRRYFGLPHHHGTVKHVWMLAVLGGALVIAVTIWLVRRRQGGSAIETIKPVK